MKLPFSEFPVGEGSGFRLHRFELYNWGTFHDRIWNLLPRGENILVTGDIGSGKSTLVDALTTLLVPPQKIAYNKAAGAEARERSLRSYVLGYFRSERTEAGLSARPVALRDPGHYSVLLGVFRNAILDQSVTLAQLFWMKELQGQPSRFYVISDRELSLATHFASAGPEIGDLKKRLRSLPATEIFESFPPYGAAFRRRFGIDNEQALDLFHQTVSMKSVGNLTGFVREHMLEAGTSQSRIEALIAHFDDLTRAHEAVVRARMQLERLRPLVEECDLHDALSGEVGSLERRLQGLGPWFMKCEKVLREKELADIRLSLAMTGERLEMLEERRESERRERDEVRSAIAQNGGDRLARIREEIRQGEIRRTERLQRSERYEALARSLDLSPLSGPEAFLENQAALGVLRERTESRRSELRERETEVSVRRQTLAGRHQGLVAEITSLRLRLSSIPAGQLALRRTLCEALGTEEALLPFAGELMAVSEEERDWEGAIERVLHTLALSLLVPDALYPAVSEWVDRNSLGGRLVYYRALSRERDGEEPVSLSPSSLVRKLVLRQESPHVSWLGEFLARHFDYACVAGMEEFRRERQALTRTGQIKGARGRHEKDDRFPVGDRTRYVLGWSNKEKIAALEREARSLEAQIVSCDRERRECLREEKEAAARIDLLGRIGEYQEYRELDWRSLALELDRMREEQRRLEEASEILRVLEARLGALEQSLRKTEEEIGALQSAKGREEHRKTSTQSRIALLGKELSEVPPVFFDDVFPGLTEELEGMFPEDELGSLDRLGACERGARQALNVRLERERNRRDGIRERLVGRMHAFRREFPAETQEMDAGMSAAPSYRVLMEKLSGDDLPRFENRFKDLLNVNTIREVAAFLSHLNRESREIRERVASINRSLSGIDYTPGRYIQLEAKSAPDGEIRDFQQDLKACTENTLTGSEDETYSEAKFLQVRRIIERFRGREGFSEQDRRWTEKVADVRNWYVFSASERWREDDTEYEHYTDSGGKSGGQKEKLAYTVLAASLAYQFGLEWGSPRTRSFRFVVIDEAFGRGSDESARYGLELFKRLNLQLLVVTPLQKIHIIEPFVSSVAFVHNPEGRESRIRNLTIEEYRTEKESREASSAGEGGGPP
ncbi:MAG: ATP-dependent exonuclease SbcCD, C subunit-like protein [Nitrospirae bacterium]|nr:ATP-dependent exonuclease SbcCD, C subunit-like protein [Nitrospirota bacterium]